MRKLRQQEPFRGRNTLYFSNGCQSTFGRLVVAGSGKGGKLNNWWNSNKFRASQRRFSLVIFLEGSSGYYANNSGFECPLEYGDFYLNFPQARFRYAPGRNEVWSEIVVGFEGPVFDLLQQEEIISPARPAWHLEDPAPWIERVSQLVQEARPKSPLGMARQTVAFVEILLSMLEAAIPKQAESASSDWFQQACVCLTSDLSRPLDLKAVADELGMNYETFRLHFRQRCGMAPGQFYDSVRCEEAKRRLLTSSACWEIAKYLGFCNEQYFSRRFKAWTGMTPREYRKRYFQSSSE
jgi:AraC-like DNA-binding protein